MSAAAHAHASTALTVESLLSVLRAASSEEMAELLTELNRGMPLWRSPEEGKALGARAKMAARAAAAAALLPEAEDGEAPLPSAYRIAAADIDYSTCVGRRLADSTKDTRWKPAVYREFQCAKPLAATGGDLCETCRARKDRYDAAPSPKVEWMGRITEEPLGWLHMLGTEWATGPKAPKWVGGDGASDTASVSSAGSGATEQMSATSTVASVPSTSKAVDKAAAATAKAAEKAAAAAAKVAAKEAEKAAKEKAKAEEKAAKEAAKAEEKAAKEAAKAAEKAAKEAAKAEEKAAKEAAKAAKATKVAAPKKAAAAGAGAGAGAAAVAAKAAPASSDTSATEGEIKLIGADLYIVKGRNVYGYDAATEKAGDFVGRLGEDGETIDADADEE
jgi:hypothetical protein